MNGSRYGITTVLYLPEWCVLVIVPRHPLLPCQMVFCCPHTAIGDLGSWERSTLQVFEEQVGSPGMKFQM